MKRSVLSLCLALGMTVALTGCFGLGSPEDTAGSAMEAVMRGSLKEFRETLSGDALEIYGTTEGMLSLRTQLAKTGARLGETEDLGSENEDGMNWSHPYRVSIIGSNPERVVANLIVNCRTTSSLACASQPSTKTAPMHNCYSTTCTIEKVNLSN